MHRYLPLWHRYLPFPSCTELELKLTFSREGARLHAPEKELPEDTARKLYQYYTSAVVRHKGTCRRISSPL